MLQPLGEKEKRSIHSPVTYPDRPVALWGESDVKESHWGILLVILPFLPPFSVQCPTTVSPGPYSLSLWFTLSKSECHLYLLWRAKCRMRSCELRKGSQLFKTSHRTSVSVFSLSLQPGLHRNLGLWMLEIFCHLKLGFDYFTLPVSALPAPFQALRS